jgi:hypothetical protein
MQEDACFLTCCGGGTTRQCDGSTILCPTRRRFDHASSWDGGDASTTSGLFLLVLQTHSIQQSLAEYDCLLFLLFVYYLLFVLATSRFHRRHNESSQKKTDDYGVLPSMIIEMVLHDDEIENHSWQNMQDEEGYVIVVLDKR